VTLRRFTPSSDGVASPQPATGEGRSRLRDTVANVAVLCVSLGVACALGELLVRAVAPQQLILTHPEIWQPVDTLGWAHRPDVNTTINRGEGTVRVITDRDGYRVGRGARVEARRRILLLGDSYMEALQVEYEQSFAGLLEARLAERIGEPVAIRNPGVSGWDPSQYLTEARRDIGREPFDLVLVSVFLGNDVVPKRIESPPLVPAEVHAFRMPRRLTYGELIDAVLYPVNDFLAAHSHLYVFLKQRTAVLRMRAGLTTEYFPEDLLRSKAGAPDWSVTAQILRDIRDLGAARNIPTLFFLIPAPYQTDTAAFRRALRGFKVDPAAVDLDQPNRLLTEAMHALGLDVLDVLADFRRAEASGSRLYGSVDLHLSPEGHDLLERLVEPEVVARLSRPTRGARAVPAFSATPK
jgi:hypothetical protein